MEKNFKKTKIEAFLERNDLKIGQLFRVSIAQNSIKNPFYFNKNLELSVNLPFTPTSEEILNTVLSCDTLIEKIIFLKNELLLLLMDEARTGNVDDYVFQGLRLQKGGLFYTILYYDSESKTGALLREIDNKVILVINFPKDGKVTWNEKGEFNTDSTGVEECKEEYRKLLHQLGSSTTSFISQ